MKPYRGKLNEQKHSKIYAQTGIDISELNGSKTGFFYGSSFQETDFAIGTDPYNIPEFQQNYATIVPQAFGLKGPVGHFDTACGSSFSALNEAFTALKSGVCDRALVAGYNICLVPEVSIFIQNTRNSEIEKRK